MFLKLLSEYRWGCIKMTSEYAFDMVFLLEFNMFLLDLWIHLIGLKQNVEMGLSNRSNR